MATYKYLQLIGTSQESWEAAAQVAVLEAAKTVPGICWVEVVEQRGKIDNGNIVEYQTTIRVAFRIDREAKA